jgi:DNA polymerase
MSDDTRQELTAWLEFYQELGIEGFYRRKPGEAGTPPSLEVAPPAQAARASSQEPVPAPAPAATPAVPPRPLAPAAQARVTAAPDPGPHTPDFRPMVRPPASAFNLFEAAPAARSGPETLEQIRQDLGDCRRCKLAPTRKTIVFGDGNPHAELVFIGEGPGADEDEQGIPFVGRAGRLLNKIMQMVGLKREDTFICNVVKCRPPMNRTPETDEIETCSPFLYRQIAAIKPRLICCLGAPAARTVLGIKEGITKVHGQFYNFGSTKALATVHPAYVLRNMREEKILIEDFEKIRDFLKGA